MSKESAIKIGGVNERESINQTKEKYIVQQIKDYLFSSRFHFSRFQFNLVALLFLTIGLVAGSYLTLKGITSIFAATTPWTQTDWSGGASAAVATGTVTTYESISSTDPTTSVGNVTLSATSSWYNAAWKYRRKVTFDNTTATLGVTSETLTSFPVLVKLDSTRIDYANTQNAGQDLRFTDSDGTTLLSYEIEKWDETGTSYIWVKVPSIDINSNTDNIYVYYGNTAATDAQAATSVWDTNYKSVWHLNEASGTTTSDSTSNAHVGTKLSATEPNPTTSGQIGGAQTFDGINDFISVPSSPDWAFGTGDFTIDYWIKWNNTASYQVPLDGGYSSNAGILIEYKSGTEIRVYAGNTIIGTFWNWNYTTGTWYHFVAMRTGTSFKLFADGVQIGSSETSSKDITATTQLIGKYSGGEFLNGWLDEFRISNTARSVAWIAASYKSETDTYNSYASQEERYVSSGTLTSNIFDSGVGGSYWGTFTYNYTGSGTVAVKVRTSSASDMTGATAFSSCTAITSAADISANSCVTDGHRYFQYQVTLTSSVADTPTFQDISLAFTPYDTTAPVTNASNLAMFTAASGGRSIVSNGWSNAASPYFSWTAGADNSGGSGLKGYCLYLGTDTAGDPATAKGLFGTSPVATTGSTCQFIVSSTSIDLSTSGYLGSALASGTTYYINVKAIDNGNNLFSTAVSFQFRQDVTTPTNVAYLTMPSQNFSNVADMNFSWPSSGSSASSDTDAGVLGWQYQINSSSGTWHGTTAHATLNLDYIPATASAYTLITSRDSSSVISGNNVIYFRTVDSAGNTSSSSTYRTGNLTYGGAAPTFGGSDEVTITPTTSTSNSFALSWPGATASGSNSVAKYYYMINTSPPSTLATLQGNTSTYIDNSTTRTVSDAALPNVNKGTNTVYVVAIDDASTPNYSPSNYISGTFMLNSTDPDNVSNLVASDSSIKSTSTWNVTLTWTAPSYQGAGNLTYLIKRSADGTTYSQVGTTTGLSYVDTAPSSSKFYYKVYTKDGANAESSGTNAVTITPAGKWTAAPTLDSGPTASSITTKKATVTWSTSRTSDSKISYGTTSGSYGSVDASNTSQVTSHSISLSNLTAGSTYYYKAKWTDEDGNTGESSEKTLTTEAAPIVTDPKAKSIGLTTATLEYTAKGATKVKIYYGKTTAFGGTKEVSTSTTETTYTTELAGLDDGAKYYYKINLFDSESVEYEGSTLTFETLPRPKISTVRVQQVSNTAQSTLLVTWTTNTDVSSIITYYPEGNTGDARDEVNVTLIKGEHRMILRGLLPQTNYTLIVKGRDKIGNEAVSDSQRVTTATDTRPPQIMELKVEGSNIPSVATAGQDQLAQLVVTWNTDEPSTSQVEFGEGTSTTYSQKTQEDNNLTTNHLVVISGLTSSKVYHMRAIAKDKAGNDGKSIDTVSITPKATENALNLVIQNLQEAFGFLGGLNK